MLELRHSSQILFKLLDRLTTPLKKLAVRDMNGHAGVGAEEVPSGNRVRPTR
jgi:hypothetical protein